MVSHGGHSVESVISPGQAIPGSLGHSRVTLSHPGSPRVPLFGIHRQQSAGGIRFGPQLHVLKQFCCLLLQGPQGATFLPRACSFCTRRHSNAGDHSSEPGSDL